MPGRCRLYPPSGGTLDAPLRSVNFAQRAISPRHAPMAVRVRQLATRQYTRRCMNSQVCSPTDRQESYEQLAPQCQRCSSTDGTLALEASSSSATALPFADRCRDRQQGVEVGRETIIIWRQRGYAVSPINTAFMTVVQDRCRFGRGSDQLKLTTAHVYAPSMAKDVAPKLPVAQVPPSDAAHAPSCSAGMK